ncbi:MAG: hypothetical protein QOF24_2401 [Verrucomicrobiota bacterium]|jgi:hypothetical protein
MAVGTLADAVGAKAYKSEQATTFVTTYINVTKGMKDQMKKLLDADTLTKNDAQFVQNTIDVLDLVLKGSERSAGFIESGDKSGRGSLRWVSEEGPQSDQDTPKHKGLILRLPRSAFRLPPSTPRHLLHTAIRC